ncbi:MAG: hypothetical protein K9L68_06585 [Spirochaetales bacterium]|nr:hypothetical protein [Spirochaetales bacterium]MCF7938250.1 hypothetical protein [Spirochaetales bacterium]
MLIVILYGAKQMKEKSSDEECDTMEMASSFAPYGVNSVYHFHESELFCLDIPWTWARR